MSAGVMTDEYLAQLLYSRDAAGQVEKIIWAATNRGCSAYPDVVQQITSWVDNPVRQSRLGDVKSGVHPWLFGKPRAVQKLVLTWLKPRPYRVADFRNVIWRSGPPRMNKALIFRKEGDPVIHAAKLFRQKSRSQKLRDFIDTL